MPSRILDNSGLAQIIVEDTVRTSHRELSMAKDATVQDCLDLLNGPQGYIAVQAMLGEYLSSYTAARVSGTVPGISLKILEYDQVEVYADGLKKELIGQLAAYLSMSAEKRAVLLQRLLQE